MAAATDPPAADPPAASSPSAAAAAVVPEGNRWPGWPGDSVFRLIVPVLKIGGIIGRKGELIKKLGEETRARVRVLDGSFGNIILMIGALLMLPGAVRGETCSADASCSARSNYPMWLADLLDQSKWDEFFEGWQKSVAIFMFALLAVNGDQLKPLMARFVALVGCILMIGALLMLPGAVSGETCSANASCSAGSNYPKWLADLLDQSKWDEFFEGWQKSVAIFSFALMVVNGDQLKPLMARLRRACRRAP